MNPSDPRPAPSPLPEGPASFALSAVSGFVDTAGFILLAGIFTSHVTGNLVLAGAAVAGRLDGGVWIRLALLGVFMLAVATTSALANWAGRRAISVVPALLSAETLMLGAFLVTGLTLKDEHQPLAGWPLFAIAATAVVAMGIQNALMREGLKAYLPTTMMTGNTTQFTLDGLAMLRGLKTPETKVRFRRSANVLTGFLTGAALGALSAAFLQMWSPVVPMLTVGLLAAFATRSPAPKAN